MLSVRQFKILFELYNQCISGNCNIAIKKLADTFSVTDRTIRSDLKLIVQYVSHSGIEITIKKNIVQTACENKQQAGKLIDSTAAEIQNTLRFDDENSRAQFIIETILLSESHVSLNKLADMMYISPSRLSQDLKNVQNILSRYNLSLDKVKGMGIQIKGNCIDKRNCLVKESTVMIEDNVYDIPSHKFKHMVERVSNMLVEILVKNQYNLPDFSLQNLILYLSATTETLLKGYTLEDVYHFPDRTDSQEYKISKEIFEKFSHHFHFTYADAEVSYLTETLIGIRESESRKYISDELNNIVVNGLLKVKQIYSIDLTEYIDLRISLALHLQPLMIRLQNDNQIQNVLTYHIKQNYSLAFEIAYTFVKATLLEYYQKYIIDDEVSYLATHFIIALNDIGKTSRNRSVLVITRQKKSNVFLLLQQLRAKFSSINNIEICHYYNCTEKDFIKYDCIIVTEKDLTLLSANCIYINYMIINEAEETRIALALSGYKFKEDFLPLFAEKLFIVGKAKNKNDAINQLYERAKEAGLADEKFLAEVKTHDESGSSYFGNNLAIVHPETPCSDYNFLSFFICAKPIQWDNFTVNIVSMLSYKKNNYDHLKIWNYISFLISNEDYLKRLYSCKN